MATAMAEIERWKQITASERARERNKATRDSLREGESAFLLTEAADFWTSCRIHTGFDLECELLVESISDSYKELHGIRPRWNFDSMSFNELESRYASLCAEAAEAASDCSQEW